MSATKATVINVPNALRAKVGGPVAALNADAIARAEEALKQLAGNFAQWLDDEIVKLEAARAAVRTGGLTAQTGETLYLRAHDLKGLGSTYEYPLISRIAASLCRLIDDPQTRTAAPMKLIEAHIDAIKAAVRGEIRDVEHPVGRVLCAELETQVREHLG